MTSTLTPGDVVTCAGACAIVVAASPEELVLVAIVSRMGRHRSDVPLPKEPKPPVANAVARCSSVSKAPSRAVASLGLSYPALLPSLFAAIRREAECRRYEDHMSSLGPWHREAQSERSMFV